MADAWTSDEELFAVVRRELFTAVVGDVMDRLGLQRQFLSPRIGPVRDDMVAVGPPTTLLGMEFSEERPSPGATPFMRKPFGLMLAALDDLKPGEIYICTGA